MDEKKEDGQNIISIPRTEMSTALKEATQSVPIKARSITKRCDARDRYIVFWVERAIQPNFGRHHCLFV